MEAVEGFVDDRASGTSDDLSTGNGTTTPLENPGPSNSTQFEIPRPGHGSSFPLPEFSDRVKSALQSNNLLSVLDL